MHGYLADTEHRKLRRDAQKLTSIIEIIRFRKLLVISAKLGHFTRPSSTENKLYPTLREANANLKELICEIYSNYNT